MDAEQENLKKDWDSRSVGKPWQHKFFYFVIRFAGRRAAYFFMYFVVLWYVLFFPPLHKKCKPYLERRFPGRKTRIARLLDEYRWITSLGRTLIDRAAFGISGVDRIKVQSPEGVILKELLNEGKGLLILGAHAGCWQIAFSELPLLTSSVYLLMYRSQHDVDKHYFEHKSEKSPFEVIDPAGYLGGVLQVAAVLQDGQTVGLMGDRVFGDDSNTIEVDFLGDPAKIPVAPYRLAAMRGTPIAVIFSHRVNRSLYVTEISGVIRVPAIFDRNSQTYLPYARQFIEYLTQYVQKHPFDFFNFFPMWKDLEF
jgi:predicted LPLAT superfamily acyltransferase